MDLVWTNTTYLEFTLTMFEHKLETGIEVVRDDDRSLPRYGTVEGGRLGGLRAGRRVRAQ